MSFNSYDNYDFWGQIDAHMTRPELRAKTSVNLYPSEASVKYKDEWGDTVVGGNCHRASWYRIKARQPRPHNARTKYIFEMGKILENMIVAKSKEVGIWVDNNVAFQTSELGFPIKGELDIVLIEPDGTIYGGEIKTLAGYKGHTEVFGNKSKAGKPKIGQLLQTLTYTFLFHPDMDFKFTNFKLPYFRMIYYDREKTSRRTFKIELHDDNGILYPKIDGTVIKQFGIDDLIQRYQLLQNYIDTDVEPPRDFQLEYTPEQIQEYHQKKKITDSALKQWESNERVKVGKSKSKNPTVTPVGDWPCRYCNYISHCYPNKDFSNYFLA